jgi:hypothetical protein
MRAIHFPAIHAAPGNRNSHKARRQRPQVRGDRGLMTVAVSGQVELYERLPSTAFSFNRFHAAATATFLNPKIGRCPRIVTLKFISAR